MAVVLKGGTVVNSTTAYKADIRIQDGKIFAVGHNLLLPGDEEIMVEGCYLIPGGIDTHTHFDLYNGVTKTADDFESGTKAALVGGTTTIIDFATQNKGETLKEAVKNWDEKSKNKCYCDFGYHMAITDWNDSVSDEMEDMVNMGIPSFKMYMAYKNVLQVDDGVIYKALKRSKEIGGLIAFHCENGDVISELVDEAKKMGNKGPKYHCYTRPSILEKEAISRLITIGKLAEAPIYIVHVSSKEGLEEIRVAKENGADIVTETCPQYLTLDDSKYDLPGFESAKYVISPPLRKESDKEALWGGISCGLIDFTGSDHCSFNFKGQKDLGINDFSKIPAGSPGVEHRMLLMYSQGVCEGKLSLSKMVEITSENAAKIMGLYPKKGILEVGSDADIVVLNPNKSSVISYNNQTQNVDYTPYEGFEVNANIDYVFLRGNLVVNHGDVVGNDHIGEFIKRNPYKER